MTLTYRGQKYVQNNAAEPPISALFSCIAVKLR